MPTAKTETKILTESVTSDHLFEHDQEHGFGVAIDIGTTTIVCYFLDLQSGIQIGSRSTLNPQIMFGEDVVSRLTHVLRDVNGKKDLQVRLWSRITDLIESFFDDRSIDYRDLRRVAVVGNTAMHHLALGLDVKSLALSPYIPTMKESYQTSGDRLGLTSFAETDFYIAPNIAGYVGSDALGFILSQGIHEKTQFTVAIDVGTNGEIVAAKNKRLVCCSAAAGPAFEGARITQGMRAQDGAIEYVKIDSPDEPPEISVIGSRTPEGFCGSAILDVVSELRKVGLLDKTGRLLEGERIVELEDYGRSYLVRTVEETKSNRSVFLTQKDIRQVQLAKAAIRAGVEILAAYMMVPSVQIETLYLAGAFGNYLRPESALRIGLLPPIDLDRIQPVGNAAGEGAKLILLSSRMRKEMEQIAAAAEYIELASTPEFETLFYRATQLSPELGEF